MLEDIAGWVAPVATIVAAMMTAANLGARVTGWGFIVFTVGSVGWSTVAIASGQQNLLWTNAFLTLVNAIGVWRWLGRQARYEDGGQSATKRSAVAPVPTLFALGSVAGAKLTGQDGAALGTVVDGMLRCDGASLAYVVVSEGGVVGVGERLHAIDPKEIVFSHEGLRCELTAEELAARPLLQQGEWPITLDEVARG